MYNNVLHYVYNANMWVAQTKYLPKWPVILFCWYSHLLLRALRIALSNSNKEKKKTKNISRV